MVDGHDVLEGIFEPFVGVDFMLLADGEEGIDHGRPLGRLVGAGEEIVFPAEGHGPYRVLHAVVVDAQVPVIEVVG